MPQRLNRLQVAERDGGQAGVGLEGQGGAIARLAVRQPRERLAVAEQEFDLEPGDGVPVPGDRIEIEVGAEQESHPAGVADRRHVRARPVHLPAKPPAKGFLHLPTVAAQSTKRRPARDDQQQEQPLVQKRSERLAQPHVQQYTFQQRHRDILRIRSGFTASPDPMLTRCGYPADRASLKMS